MGSGQEFSNNHAGNLDIDKFGTPLVFSVIKFVIIMAKLLVIYRKLCY